MSSNEGFFKSLTGILGIDEWSTMDEIVAAAEALRAEAEIQQAGTVVLGGEAVAMDEVVTEAIDWYNELIRIGSYKQGQVFSSPDIRSDRWPFEVDLVRAVESYLAKTNRLVPAIQEIQPGQS